MQLSKQDICAALAADWSEKTGHPYEAFEGVDDTFFVRHDCHTYTVKALEAVNITLERIAKYGLKTYGDNLRGEYVGPLTYLQGKKAILRNGLFAQFDDLGTYLAYGWHNFDARDFRIEPRAPMSKALASMCEARRNCADNNNKEWLDRWTDRIERMVKEHMPSGSGFDAGTTLDIHESGDQKLVFNTSFHHMDESGGYDGWTEHQVIARPSLSMGFTLRVTGPNRNDIKEYIQQQFDAALSQEVPAHGYD